MSMQVTDTCPFHSRKNCNCPDEVPYRAQPIPQPTVGPNHAAQQRRQIPKWPPAYRVCVCPNEAQRRDRQNVVRPIDEVVSLARHLVPVRAAHRERHDLVSHRPQCPHLTIDHRLDERRKEIYEVPQPWLLSRVRRGRAAAAVRIRRLLSTRIRHRCQPCRRHLIPQSAPTAVPVFSVALTRSPSTVTMSANGTGSITDLRST